MIEKIDNSDSLAQRLKASLPPARCAVPRRKPQHLSTGLMDCVDS
jgi:hypothetical protein